MPLHEFTKTLVNVAHGSLINTLDSLDHKLGKAILRDGESTVGDGSDHTPSGTAAATQSPEKIGSSSLVVSDHKFAVCGDDLHSEDVVNTKTEGSTKGSVTTTQSPANDTDSGCPARVDHTATSSSRFVCLAPDEARTELDLAMRSVLGALEIPLGELHKTGADEKTIRAAVSVEEIMPSASHAHAEVVLVGESDQSLDMGVVEGEGNEGRLPVLVRVVASRSKAELRCEETAIGVLSEASGRVVGRLAHIQWLEFVCSQTKERLLRRGALRHSANSAVFAALPFELARKLGIQRVVESPDLICSGPA
eukprot:Colp12_sorted_trinity150504_noHs@5172